MHATKVRRLPRVPSPIWVLALAIGCALVAISPSAASSGTKIQVSSANGAPGQSLGVNVTAMLNSNDTMNGFDIQMSFDPTIVHVTSITSPGWSAVPGSPAFDNVGGTLHMAGFQLGTGCAKSSSCGLFSVAFTAVAPGSSMAHVTGGTFAGSDAGTPGAIAGVTAFDGKLDVSGGSATAAPTTATAAPTTATAAPTTATAAPTTAVPRTTTSTATTQPPAAATTPAGTVTAPAVVTTPLATATSISSSDDGTPDAATATPAAATAEPTSTSATPAPAVIATVAAPSPPPASGAVAPVALAPLPPATGSGGAAPWDSGQSPARFSGWLLVLVSLGFLVARGAKNVAETGRSPIQRAGAGRALPVDAARDSEPSIEDVVVRYLSDQEAAALREHHTDDDEAGR
jgi:hypothetical protein